MEPAEVRDAASTAVELIGNASARISQLPREKIIATVNKTLLPLAKEDEPYADAAPNLFGSDFTKRSKEFLDQVKVLCSTLPARNREQEPKKFFRRGPPSKRVVQKFGRDGASSGFRGRDRPNQSQTQRQ